jgi:uncharacterized membrane protein YfcA
MTDYVIIFIATFIGSFVHCLIGFADALLIMPFLLIFYDLPTADVITNNYAIIIGVLLTKYSLSTLKGYYLELCLLSISYTMMTLVGAFMLHNLDIKLLMILLSTVLLLYPLIIKLSSKLYGFRINKWFSILFGGISGFLGVTTTVNGPPLVLYGQLRKYDVNTFVAILQPVFLLGAIINCYHYYYMGILSMKLSLITLSTIPIVIFNYYIAKRLRDKFDELFFRNIIIAVIFTSGVIMTAKSLF